MRSDIAGRGITQIAYLPCELKSRDMEPRMLIAAHLLAAGIPVVIGQQWEIANNRHVAPAGCFLFGTANKIQSSAMEEVKRFRHVIIASDQEALPFAGEAFLDNIDPAAVDAADCFLVATESHELAMRARYPSAKTHIVGSPRIDLLRTAKPERPQEQDYILFNTSFALTNSVWGSTEAAVNLLGSGGGVTPEVVRERLLFELASKDHLLSLLHWSAAELPWQVVVRPHPAEDAAAWNKLKSTKIKIVSGESPVPWIKHARLMVHANSTTGLEAAILGCPCINISPEGQDRFVDQYVVRSINFTVRTAEQAMDAINRWRNLRIDLNSRDAAKEYPDGSAKKIADIMGNVLKDAPRPASLTWEHYERSEAQKAKFSATQEELVNCFLEINRLVGVRSIGVQMLGDSVMMIETRK